MRHPHIRIVAAGLSCVSVLIAHSACSQTYPVKSVRVLVSPAGGGNDFVARVIGPGLSATLGQQVVIDNRPTRTLPDVMTKSAPDGYTLMIMSAGLWLFPFMAKVDYDMTRDFAPISLAVKSPNVLVVHPSLPVKSAKELIALAKARPGQINYSVGGLGGMSHLSVELFKTMAGINMTMVNYRSGSQETADLVGGQVQLAFNPAGSASGYVKSGRLRGVAVTTAEPSALFPNLPTVAASGLPGYEAVSTYGVFAPAKTPEVIIRRINQDVVRFVNLPEARERLAAGGTEPAGTTPEAFAAVIKSDMAKWGKVIRDAGIRDE
jgi:tripartite-type tricarboxylate transporter receptor subunit TctC